MLSLIDTSEALQISQAEIERMRRQYRIHIALIDVYAAATDATQRKMSGYKKPLVHPGEDGIGLIESDFIPF